MVSGLIETDSRRSFPWLASLIAVSSSCMLMLSKGGCSWKNRKIAIYHSLVEASRRLMNKILTVIVAVTISNMLR